MENIQEMNQGKMKEFIAVFQLSKTKIFEASYYTLLKNEHANFTTSCSEFCRNKKDYSRCGQCQKDTLRGFEEAMKFYKKWNCMHLCKLTEEQYNEMSKDLGGLCEKYNYIIEELDESKKPYNPYFSFDMLAEWTKQNPKKN